MRAMGRIPNLFVVGAMRAGTTALHEALDEHPQIFMSAYKEPAFFADPSQLAIDSRIVAEAGFAGNEAAYLGLFDSAGDVAFVGESSTHYTKAPRITGVAQRISDYSSGARIVYLVRNPVERALSHYEFDLIRRYETRPALAAFRSNPFYLQVSDYALQIGPFLDRFGERVVLLTLEELVASPAEELGRLFEWLGVEAERGPTRLPQRNQITDDLGLSRDTAPLRLARRAGWYRRVVGAVPKPIRARLRRVAARDTTRAETRSDDVVEYLTEQLEPAIDRFEQLVGRRFDLWRPTGAPSSAPGD